MAGYWEDEAILEQVYTLAALIIWHMKAKKMSVDDGTRIFELALKLADYGKMTDRRKALAEILFLKAGEEKFIDINNFLQENK